MSIPVFSFHESGYHDCPMDAHKAGEVLAALREKYGTEELTDLSRESGIPRQTLVNWQAKPETIVRSPGRKYLQRAVEGHASNEEIIARLDRIEKLLHGLSVIDSQGRLGEVVKSKAKKHGGGAA